MRDIESIIVKGKKQLKTKVDYIFTANSSMKLKNSKGDFIKLDKGSDVICYKVNYQTVFFYNAAGEQFQLPEKEFKECFELSSEVVENKSSSKIIKKIDLEKNTKSQNKIINVLDAMKDLLLYKNRKYGDSALHPNNVFYKGDSTNSILIRLDDKLGRIKNNDGEIRVNDVCDLIGYLTLLLVSMGVDVSEIEKLKD